MKKYIIGNWKMHGMREAGLELAQAVARHPRHTDATVVICPPFTLLGGIASALGKLPHPNPLPKGEGIIKLGAQDCHAEEAGAHTGDISAAMLKDAGCEYVIVGHSERRQGHGETNDMVRKKAEAAVKAGLTPIVCVGESWAEREAGRHLETVARQVRESVPGARGDKRGTTNEDPSTLDPRPYLIAYEPIWAIGSGKTPTLAEISEVHKHIAKSLPAAITAPIVYGGSVKPENARDILHAEGISGVLVGGASLRAIEFCAIIDAA